MRREYQDMRGCTFTQGSQRRLQREADVWAETWKEHSKQRSSMRVASTVREMQGGQRAGTKEAKSNRRQRQKVSKGARHVAFSQQGFPVYCFPHENGEECFMLYHKIEKQPPPQQQNFSPKPRPLEVSPTKPWTRREGQCQHGIFVFYFSLLVINVLLL